MPNKVDIGYLVCGLMVSLLPNILDCIFMDSILISGMPNLAHMNHHSMMPFIHYECTNYFFNITFGISQDEIQVIAVHIAIAYYKYQADGSIGYINHYKNLSFKNKTLGYINYFNIRYYAFTFYSDFQFIHRLIQISDLWLSATQVQSL